jgi:hypothetical protein
MKIISSNVDEIDTVYLELSSMTWWCDSQMTWPKVPLTTSLGLKLFFVHMIGIPITSSKIIGKWLVLSSCKQLKFRCLKIKRIKHWPLVTRTWNCIGGDSLYMANSNAHECTSDRKEEKDQKLECCSYEPYYNHLPLEV